MFIINCERHTLIKLETPLLAVELLNIGANLSEENSLVCICVAFSVSQGHLW